MGGGNSCCFFNANGDFPDDHPRWHCLCGRAQPSRVHLLWSCECTEHLRTALRPPTDTCEERLLLQGVPEQPPASSATSMMIWCRRLPCSFDRSLLCSFWQRTAPSTVTSAPMPWLSIPAASPVLLAMGTRTNPLSSRSFWASTVQPVHLWLLFATLDGAAGLSLRWTPSRL